MSVEVAPLPDEPDAALGRSSPILSAEIRGRLGTLLAGGYALEDAGSDATGPFADLLGKLDAALGQARDRDEAEFRKLLLATAPALRRFAISLARDPTAADDLVQNTFLRAWKNQSSFAKGTNIEAWVFTILRNQFYSDRRKSREVQDDDGAHAARLISLPTQSARLDIQDLQVALAQLNPVMREALLLVTVQDLSYEEAAAIMGCQLGTAKSRAWRAREHLVKLLGYNGSEVGSDALLLSALNTPSKTVA